MGTKYPGVSISGYNSSPPADDGSATEANKTKWSTIKSKITDPVKTLAEAMDTALATAFDYSAVSKTANYTVTSAEHMKTIECDGTFTVTLGAAASLAAGFITTIKNVGSGTITVDGNGSETVDGDLTLDLTQYDSVTVSVDSGSGGWNIESLVRDGLGDVTSTEIGYLSGVTSAIQTQLDAKISTSAGSVSTTNLDVTYHGGELIKLSDVKSASTSGGTFTAGSWQTRDLNTEDNDTGTDCTLSSNQFTLSAGTYEIEASAPAYAVDIHQAKLYNATDTSDIILGTAESTSNGNAVVTRSIISGIFTIGASKALEIQHRCSGTKSSNGFGVGATWGNNVYTVVKLRKID